MTAEHPTARNSSDRPRTVMVVGATGRTGRHVVAGLLEAGVGVQALVRTPATADLPDEVTVIPGTLTDVDAVRRAATGADAAFLMWLGHDPAEVGPTVTALTEQVSHVVYLSAADLQADSGPTGVVQPGVYAEVEAAIERSGRTWTFVRGGGFAANALEWADQVRAGNTVRLPHPEAGRSVVDERDLAEVAVRGLLDPSMAGRAFALTGPETLTLRQQVGVIGHVLGRDLVVAERDADEVRSEYAAFMGADFADQVLGYWATLTDHPEPVTTGVEAALGRTARPFVDWVHLHRAEFDAQDLGDPTPR
ncbi:SDR family oxidoreductase [Microlunatus sp. Y2014]|uniref:SDR family oxidoreductase n=1 Tax=Microlunatus sp. Y2014 TaxID=3418488 RepID=UPI003DA77E00